MTLWSLGLAYVIHTWVGQSLGTVLRPCGGRSRVVGKPCYGLVRSLGTSRRYHAMGARGYRGHVADGRGNRSGRVAPLGVWPLSTLGRSGDTRVRVIGSRIWLVGHVRDAQAIPALVVWSSRAMQVWAAGWDATAIPSVGSEWDNAKIDQDLPGGPVF